jgi:hypothetical protein
MTEDNFKDRALLEDYKQSWLHLRHIEDQRWKVFMIFGTICGIYVSAITIGNNQILSPISILASCLFFQLFASIILLILLKWRYAFCIYMEDIQRKRKRFEFTQIESVFAGEPAPKIFKSDSVHWAIILFFWLVAITAVIAPIALLGGSKTALYFSLDIVCYIWTGCGMGIGVSGVISFKEREKIRKFFEKHEKMIPVSICMVTLLLLVLMLLLYIYSGDIVVFVILLQFILLLALSVIFVYLWLTYTEDLEKKKQVA